MVEHTAVNRGVVGSSPTRGASEEKNLPAELSAGFLYAGGKTEYFSLLFLTLN